jgi:hypothetical protein
MIDENTGVTETVRLQLEPVVEKWKAQGWAVIVKRPTSSGYSNPRVCIEVISPDQTAHALTIFDEDESLSDKAEQLIIALSN